MKARVYNLEGKASGEIVLARVFKEPVRIDIIKRAFLAERSHKRQAYGADPLAGQRSSAHFHGSRHYRYTMQNREMSRMKRIHNQGFLNYTARVIPGTVKGRKAHPPKAEKVFTKKLNKKERSKAIFSSIAATIDRDFLVSRGHTLDRVNFPIVLVDKVQELKKSRDMMALLKVLGLEKELERCKPKKASSSKGKMRGRPYKRKTGPLMVVKDDNGIIKSSSNIPGFDAVTVSGLTVELLAPGGQPGRMTLWSKSAIEELEKQSMS